MRVEMSDVEPTDLPIVLNLVPHYVYDMSEWMGWNCNADGTYDGCDDLPEYLSEPWGSLYVLRVNDRLAGFTSVRRLSESPASFDMGEFFVIRKFRRKGVGKEAAEQLFERFRGDWQIRCFVENTPAVEFWRSVVSSYSRGEYRESIEDYSCPHSGKWRMVFLRFRSR